MLDELHSFKLYESRLAVWSCFMRRKGQTGGRADGLTDVAIEVGMKRYAKTSIKKL
jgi:hypothetical protein